jgi:hypothetical protein
MFGPLPVGPLIYSAQALTWRFPLLKCPDEKWHISMTVRTHLISPAASDHLSDETGAYTYGLGHQMKPQRIRMTHELVMAYGMLEKLHVIVGLQNIWASENET